MEKVTMDVKLKKLEENIMVLDDQNSKLVKVSFNILITVFSSDWLTFSPIFSYNSGKNYIWVDTFY